MVKNSENVVTEKRKYQDKASGAFYDEEGKKFEQEVEDLLNYPDNLLKFKTNDNSIEGFKYEVFIKIMNTFKINPKEVFSLWATCDKTYIGRLPSGGSPKTDVVVNVLFNDNSSEFYTLNTKRTTRYSVSGHEYSADAFADVLDPDNDKLRMFLRDFQRAGNKKNMTKGYAELLKEELKPYNKKLFTWVLSGRGAEAEEIQYAQYLLTCQGKDNISIYSIEEYYNKLIERKVNITFGTFFSWTYASGSRGKDIQLKIKVFRD